MRTRIALEAGKRLECWKSFWPGRQEKPSQRYLKGIEFSRHAEDLSESGRQVIAEIDYQFVIYAYCQCEESPRDIKSF